MEPFFGLYGTWDLAKLLQDTLCKFDSAICHARVLVASKYWTARCNKIWTLRASTKSESVDLLQTYGKQLTHMQILCSLKSRIPQTITHLTFGHCFNENILGGTLPLNLLHLEIGSSFNSVLVLPSKLTTLRLGDSFTDQNLLRTAIPTSVTELRLGKNVYPRNLGAYLPNLRILTLTCYFGEVPETLQELHLSSYCALDKLFPAHLQKITFHGIETDAKVFIRINHSVVCNGDTYLSVAHGDTTIICLENPSLGLFIVNEFQHLNHSLVALSQILRMLTTKL
jgi:hypothetical protein